MRACYDVAVVGLGPAGATLANLLGQRGLQVLVLEREADIYPLPRAIQFDAECMRVFQAIGIADALEPTLGVIPGMRFLNAAGELLINWERATDRGPEGWHASYRFHQPMLEAALRGQLRSLPNVEVRLRHEVLALEERDDAVTLRCSDLSGGAVVLEQARFVVGCDGARSLVRRCMDAAQEDLGASQRWLVADVVLERDLPHLGEYSVQYCDPARPATYVRGVGLRRRWELMLKEGENAREIWCAERVWQLLAPWVSPGQGRLERPAVYTFNSILVHGWRRGRMLLAGDAVHLTPPFMGQGMCAGIRDAANLAWKLADVVQGAAAPALLDSYESERAPHVREFIEAAVRLGGVIQSTDPAAAARRDAELLAAPELFTTPRPALGPGRHDGHGPAGRRSEQPVIDGQRLDDIAGYRHCLLALPPLAAAVPSLPGLCVVPARDGQALDWLQRLGAGAVLLRPDRYVAGTANDVDELRRLLSAYL